MDSGKKEFDYNGSQLPKIFAAPEQLFYENPDASQPMTAEVKSEAISHTRKTHSSCEQHECPGCLTKFLNPDELQKHIIYNIDTVNPGTLRCNQSYQDVFKTDSKADVSSAKPHQCRDCSRLFKTKGELRSHEMIHTDVKPFKCVSCVATFKRKTELRRHELVHLNLSPYQCSECVRAYRTRGELKSHFVIHSNFREFKCTDCNIEFKRRAELNRHIAGHQAPSSIMCLECRSITNPDDLKKHVMASHGIKLFICRHCPAEFIREDDFREHSVTHSTISVECSVCKKIINNVSKAVDGPVICPSCSRVTRHVTNVSASDSMVSHSSHPSEAAYQNVLAGSEESCGLFECKDCNKVFRSKAQLGSHRMTHSPLKAFK